MTEHHQEYLAGRRKWEHEDHLINQRLTWLLNSQSLLFAAYAIALQSVSADTPNRALKFVSVCPFIGIATSSLILIGILAATDAMRILKKGKYTFDVRTRITWAGIAPAYCLPIVFIVAWCAVR